MGVALKDLKGKVKRPVRTVKVCLDGDLWEQHDELSTRLNAATGAEAVEVAKELRAVEEAMRAAEVEIKFRGINSFTLAEIQARFPTESGRGWDVNAGAPALIAACAVEPTTEEEAREFLSEVNFAVNDKLFSAAWEATTGSGSVPTSARASALINASA